MHRRTALPLFLTFVICSVGLAQSPTPCPALAHLQIPNTKILAANAYPAGEFPAGELPAAMAAALKFLPALCRVTAELTPTPDSSIKVELWMPAAESKHWNGRFRGQGNGGFAGEINYWALALSVFDGYASAGTDTGHAAAFNDATWAKGHPEKIADFGYRAIHLMTERSKQIIAAYYGTAAKKSYFAACSDGGREALMEAQRFPADYDGILAGAPAYNWTGLVSSSLHTAQAVSATPASFIAPEKLATVTSAVLARCDANDSVVDGILTSPDSCPFKPSDLLCKSTDSPKCLSAAQVKTLEALYAGAKGRDGKVIFRGYAPGGEADGWAQWVTGIKPGSSLAFAFAEGYFTNMVYPDGRGLNGKKFDIANASLDDAFEAANRTTAADINATDADLKPFIARGGKLILYHGWNDPAISPYSTVDYYNRLLTSTGKQATEQSVRLYMAPGMGHCGGGPGPDNFGQSGWLPTQGPDDPKHDAFLALQQWVEGGPAPNEIIASKYQGQATPEHIKRSRPLCPYPQVAKYNRKGDKDKAESFACAAE